MIIGTAAVLYFLPFDDYGALSLTTSASCLGQASRTALPAISKMISGMLPYPTSIRWPLVRKTTMALIRTVIARVRGHLLPCAN